MVFSLEKLFIDVFAPQSGEVVTIMYDLPHDDIHDTKEWSDRVWSKYSFHPEYTKEYLINPKVIPMKFDG
jgi:hypothetical protein